MAPRLGNVMCIPAPPWCANEIYPAAVREAFRVNLQYWGEPTRGGQFGDREHQRQLSVRPAEPKTSTGAVNNRGDPGWRSSQKICTAKVLTCFPGGGSLS